MKKNLSMMMLVLVMAIVMAACGNNTNNTPNNGATGGTTNTPQNSAEPDAPTSIKVTHLLGETNAPINPSKVVVFDFGVLDTLDRLGVESIVAVPQDSLPAYLEKYASADYINAGGLKEPDFEAIDGAKPDLIIISGRQSDAYEELNKIAPTIYMGVDNADYLKSFTSNVETLATIFGKEEQAATELAAINEVIENVKANVSTTDKKGLIVLANEGKISAYGPGSRFGIIHDVLGVPAVDETLEISTHGNEITFEYIAEKNPGYLFVIDRTAAVGGEGNAKDTIENDLVKNTDAFKEGHITYLDPQYWYLSGGGLISVEKMVKDIDAAVK
ncbi:siderophore ABC transporter substrate-binding protein [Paenibacillus endoradicis]|uniref:siderophore ABC transporter substrate-binding protein n=1 Tax=Paenibacillus endoradicis TaxID=2972487 RepID=UPI0021596276|nr:siderophore ABC transporter substrate-binding protein [Paenibacillus endoradicis]MCR8657048.1 siderophore ABC transporter substrate-binding protein [Paenibacillus endoradicis]